MDSRNYMKLSICIPTYNRAALLENCLYSIIQNKSRSSVDFEVCVSDNGSTDGTEAVVRNAQKTIAINYSKNPTNLGPTKNFLKVVEMARGEFVWLIGDDDLLMQNALVELSSILDNHKKVDFLYVNAFHLTTDYIFSHPHPFKTDNFPVKMEPFSPRTTNGEINFLDLINPKVSFDFLGGIFLAVFRRKNWIENAYILDQDEISDLRTFANFDNSFPHVKIFAKAFANSRAFFNACPFSVCLTGAREWAPLSPFMRSVRLVETLDEYRNNGLGLFEYLYCRNYALRYFLPDLALMLTKKGRTGIEYINMWKLILRNCLYPNFYFSFFYFFARKAKHFLLRHTRKPW